MKNELRGNNSGMIQKTLASECKGLRKIKVLSGAQLKYIAFISMVIDHVNQALITPYLSGEGFLFKLSLLFNVLGRIAFPLFALFLVEGFFKTGSRKKYLASLLMFAVISEVPFDLFLSREFFNIRGNNVLFSLALALVTIWLIDALKGKFPGAYAVIWYLLSFVIVAASCLATMFLSSDYEYHAILMVYSFYLFYDKPLLANLFGYLAIFKEVWSLLGFGLTLTYNGERGKQYKWLNYMFYPVHLLVIGIIRLCLNV